MNISYVIFDENSISTVCEVLSGRNCNPNPTHTPNPLGVWFGLGLGFKVATTQRQVTE